MGAATDAFDAPSCQLEDVDRAARVARREEPGARLRAILRLAGVTLKGQALNRVTILVEWRHLRRFTQVRKRTHMEPALAVARSQAAAVRSEGQRRARGVGLGQKFARRETPHGQTLNTA